MKNIAIYMWLACFSVVACTEDIGTYDYVSLNDVEISGIEKTYYVVSGMPFAITPETSRLLNDNDSDLEYMWYAYTSGQMTKADTLSHQKDLSLDKMLLEPATYVLAYKIKDTSTGVFYSAESSLNVKGFSDGLYVLSNRNGDAQVAILRGEEEGESDFDAYKLINGEIVGTNPVGIIGIKKNMTMGAKPVRIAIGCNDETLGAYVSGSTFEKTVTIASTFNTIDKPSSITGVIASPHTLGNSLAGVFDGDGHLYTASLPGYMNKPECDFWRKLDTFSDKFRASYNSTTCFMLYNTTTKGFGITDSWGQSVTMLPVSSDASVPFDVTNTGLEALYGKACGDYSMGVFEDSSSRYILALSGTDAAFKIEIAGSNVAEANKFEFLNAKQILFYAAGNKIYTYDIVARSVMYEYSLPEGKVVDQLVVSQDDKTLFVGFSDGTNAIDGGSVHLLNIDLDGELLGVAEKYDNKFGQVVGFFENY